MRGITPTERYLLDASASPMTVPVGDMREEARALVSTGRIELNGCVGTATDLGRLALRVCPVDEF